METGHGRTSSISPRPAARTRRPSHAPVRPCVRLSAGVLSGPGAAFTLVELLIVVTILGTLAVVAIPQLGDTSKDAKIAALDRNLSVVRTAIERYRHEHNSKFPGVVAIHEIAEMQPLEAHVSPVDALTKQLSLFSNAAGNTSARKSSDYPYGPYLRKGMPENPLPAPGAEGAAAGVTVTKDTGPLGADVKPLTGWKMSSETGEFIANNDKYASR